MSTQAPIARHRAETQSLATIAKAVSSNAGSMGLQAAVIAAASGMVLTTGFSSTAGGTVERDASGTSELQVQTAADIQVSASSQAELTFDRPDVKSTAAPEAPEPAPAPEPVVEPQSNQVEAVASDAAETRPQQPAQNQQPAQGQQPAEATAQPKTTGNAAAQTQSNGQPTSNEKPAASSGSVSAGIASAAYAQLGVSQDCTMLVTNALAAVGIDHHGWPDSYFSLGTQVSASQARPGDIVYYADGGMGMAHIAVYVGNGQAVHGGWEGGKTVLESVNVGSGPVYIRVNG
ncbi:NlpC/P60 family protein [Arthrobacter pigmenti]